MRLTLRTLLAYLDDVLDPVDKEELATKIESSEFAEDLVHRTRDTVRRLRLSAPQVIGNGMGLDPNSVAEYLDNVMPPDQVGDFERICLESDVHLAEATACHHVLTMVLGEPADVDPIARQRMYTIGTEANNRKQIRVEPAHKAPVATAVAAATMPAPAMPTASVSPRAVEVPEYLRTASWWRSTNALIGLATVVLVGTAIVFASGIKDWIGNKPSLEPMTAQNTAPAPEASATNTAPEVPAASAGSVPPAENSTALGAPPPPATPAMPPLMAAPPATESSSSPDQQAATNPPAAIPPIADTPPQPASDIAGPLTAAADAAPPVTAPAAADIALPVIPPTTVSPTTPPADAASNLARPQSTALIPPQPGLSLPETTPPDTATPSATAPSLSAPGEATAANPTEPPTAAPPVESLASAAPVPLPPASAAPTIPGATIPPASRNLGTYMGGKTVLLRFDDKAGTWFRVEPRAAITPGERLLALPEFRPKVVLATGVNLDVAGGTEVIVGTASASADPAAKDSAVPIDTTPTLEVVYGRIVLINPTNNEQQVHLKLGPFTGTAKIAPNKTVAAEVDRKFVPGQDPRQAPAPVDVRLFAPEGGIAWNDASGEKSIDKPSRWALTTAGAADLAEDTAPPEWIDHEPIVQLSEQRYGAPEIETALLSNAPAETQLLELFQSSKRKEVKSLVARSSIHVGLFQPFIDALRDSEQKANWKSQIDALRAAMALSPESANKVWQALVDQRGKPAATDLYEMLCSYNPEQIGQTPEQIKTGAIAKLINWLEDDSLDYRVLASRDLAEITGKQFMQNPAAKLPERTQNVKRWRARLEAGELKPSAAPAAP